MTTTLKQYAKFLLEQKLDEFISVQVEQVLSFNIPLMQYFSHLSKKDLYALSRNNNVNFLVSIESGDPFENIKQTLENWQSDKVAGIPKEAVSIPDLTSFYAAQKIAMQAFLSDFTNDINISKQLLYDIEIFYKHVYELAFQTLEAIQSEESKKLKETEEKFADLFENASDLIYFLSPDGSIMYTNNAWLKVLGYSKEEVHGRSIYDFIKDEDKQVYLDQRKKVLTNERLSVDISSCFVAKDGKLHTLEGFISCRFKDDKPFYTRAILRDVTERKQQEKRIEKINEELKEREENLTNIIDNAPDAVVVIDETSNILLWNPKAEEVFGWKKNEVLNKPLAEAIIPHHLREAHYKGMNRYMTTGETHILNRTVEITGLHKSGHELFVSITISVTRQAGKRAFIAFLRDITQQKKNEQELENKRKQLEKTNAELEKYAWLTSHDLKEPIRKILTFSDSLITKEENNLSEKTFNYLKKINNAAKRMNALIEAVLQYSSVTDDQQLFEKVDLSQTLTEVIEELELPIAETNTTITASELPVIKGIPVQMRQLFQNIISNAIKYRKTDVAPKIAINAIEVEGGYRINIKDNGVGFDNIYASKIFEVFQRLLHTKNEGTGIGLALCKKIVDTHRGSIYAEGEPGVGSTFVIFLPKE